MRKVRLRKTNRNERGDTNMIINFWKHASKFIAILCFSLSGAFIATNQLWLGIFSCITGAFALTVYEMQVEKEQEEQ